MAVRRGTGRQLKWTLAPDECASEQQRGHARFCSNEDLRAVSQQTGGHSSYAPHGRF
jgi:hypothetical protein